MPVLTHPSVLFLILSALGAGRECATAGVALASTWQDTAAAQAGHWAPREPPRVRYVIDCRIDGERKLLEGSEQIHLTHDGDRPLRRLAFDWALSEGQTLAVSLDGTPLPVLDPEGTGRRNAPLLVDLPEPLAPGDAITLEVTFRKALPFLGTQDQVRLGGWHPRLDWGYETHADFEVRLQVPPDHALATSGRLDESTGTYVGEGIRDFGLFLGRGMQALEDEAGDVRVRCVFPEAAEPCARLLLETAVDVIGFYEERFGLYPHHSLCIVPGADRPMGGYPQASGLVVIHGQEQFARASEEHWRWITAHEIGHQYWLEYVMRRDVTDWSWGWLMIGLGLWADREYLRDVEPGQPHHTERFQHFTQGVQQRLDTTVERPPEQHDRIDFDFNNVVVHSKGFAIVSALDCILGDETFEQIYLRCLADFGGRRMGARDFQRICEEESGQELSWFFDAWLRTPRYPSYEIVSTSSIPQGDEHLSEVQVRCLGTLKMPVPVLARFEDGTEQLRFTDRHLDLNVLRFTAAAPLAEAILDPHRELALVLPPPEPTQDDVVMAIFAMDYTGVGSRALELYREAVARELPNAEVWAKLGLTLYDGGFDQEALDAFTRAAAATDQRGWMVVWQGHLLDLLGRREEALERYRQAIREAGLRTQHDQYGIVIDRAWVEARLREPFARR